MQKILLFVMLAVAFTSCGPQIYTSASFQEAKVKHKTVAIVPFDVIIESRRLPKGVTVEMIQQQQKDYGHGLQSDAYGYYLRQMSKDHYTVNFQDVTKTNALLADAGITYENLNSTSRDLICNILGVDAIVSGKATMSKPMSDGAAIAVGILVGAWGATNTINTSITIHEGERGDLLWKYDYAASGSVGSNRQSLSNALMRNSSKKFPYKKS
jgi:hypothetical protein